MNVAETFTHAGCLVKICWDEDPESPRELDCFGRMVCWHSRYFLGDSSREFRYATHTDGTTFSEPGEFQEWWDEHGKGGVILPLHLYDHSGITIRCAPFSCPWDSGQVGWVYATREMMLAEFSGKRVTAKMRANAEKIVRQEVETYDEFLTGQVYGYEVYELEPVDEDFDGSDEDREGDFVDSCWGFYGGIEYCRQQAREAAEGHAKKPA